MNCQKQELTKGVVKEGLVPLALQLSGRGQTEEASAKPRGNKSMGRGTGSEPAAAGKLENQGALTIKVVALRGLSRSSRQTDPYVELCLDGQSMTTPAVNNTGGNSDYDVSLGPFVRKLNSDSLVVRVWDSDTDMLGRIKSKPDENVVAECEIGLSQLDLGSDPNTPLKFNLSTASNSNGQIWLCFETAQTQPARPTGGRWKLKVGLKKAEHLPKMDTFGKCDPYAVLQIGEQKFQSETIKNTYSPEWSQDFVFDIDTNAPVKDLYLLVQIFDWDRFSKDDEVGTARIDISPQFLQALSVDPSSNATQTLDILSAKTNSVVMGNDRNKATLTLFLEATEVPTPEPVKQRQLPLLAPPAPVPPAPAPEPEEQPKTVPPEKAPKEIRNLLVEHTRQAGDRTGNHIILVPLPFPLPCLSHCPAMVKRDIQP